MSVNQPETSRLSRLYCCVLDATGDVRYKKTVERLLNVGNAIGILFASCHWIIAVAMSPRLQLARLVTRLLAMTIVEPSPAIRFQEHHLRALV